MLDLVNLSSLSYNFLIYTIPFLFVLTAVVFFHELGHFVIARLNRVDVETFSVGFGREIFSTYDKKGTKWKICWIPLGGYVKFVDDADPTSKADKNKLSENGFHSKSILQRSSIVSAGPIANFILALVIFTFLYTVNGKTTILPVIESIEESSPAMNGGLKVDDIIISIDEVPINKFGDIPRVIQEKKTNELQFGILRKGSYINVNLTPEIRYLNPEKKSGEIFYIGIGGGTLEKNILKEKLSVIQAIGYGINDTYQIIHLSLSYIYKMVIGAESTENLGGPIRIAQISGDVAKNGIMPLLQLTALLSVSIGLINLFPIPMLDGGHLMFYLIEAIRGKPLSERSFELFHKIGLGFIIFLMFFALWNDLNFLNIF